MVSGREPNPTKHKQTEDKNDNDDDRDKNDNNDDRVFDKYNLLFITCCVGDFAQISTNFKVNDLMNSQVASKLEMFGLHKI